MLHELLLCLSGQMSALFDPSIPNGRALEESFPLLSREEANLLAPIHRLAQIHRALQSHAKSIGESHPSVVCRAVATDLITSHLSVFQTKLVELERRILTADSSVVGADNIVPLSSITCEFSEWIHLMDWYWQMAIFMLPHGRDKSASDAPPCSGAALIDRLRLEARTGYPVIQDASLRLSTVAETAWLRQLSGWILFGRLPEVGADDFFIQSSSTEDVESTFVLDTKRLPKFVSARTAASMLFIGKSRNQIRELSHSQSSTASVSLDPDTGLHHTHLQYLAEVTTPVSSSRLSSAVSAIRLSLSRNALQKLLPLPKIVQLLSMLQEFFLLGRGEFAVSLIYEADQRLGARQKSQSNQPAKSLPGVSGVLMKEGEVSSILSRTWSVLSSYLGDDEAANESLEFARELLHLELRRPSSARPSTPGRAKEDSDTLPILSSVSFYDVLVHAPVDLTMDVPSPFDLFITPAEVALYSGLHSYLLAIRRSHVHLTDLWKEASTRRVHPPPLGPPHSNLPHGRKLLQERRQRATKRNVEMRKLWATCSAAVFLLSEFINYFEGEVVRESCNHFHRWVTRPSTQSTTDQSQSSDASPSIPSDPVPHDPETLATAHRRFLGSLAHSVLLTDVPYTKSLRALITSVDQLTALMKRLQIVQQKLDLQEDEGVVDAMANHEQDERDVKAQLSRSRRHVDTGMKAVVARLRELDAERTGRGGLAAVGALAAGDLGPLDEYMPLRGGNLDGLLMKLDFGRMSLESPTNDM